MPSFFFPISKVKAVIHLLGVLLKYDLRNNDSKKSSDGITETIYICRYSRVTDIAKTINSLSVSATSHGFLMFLIAHNARTLTDKVNILHF
jgi:hypothetical protein